MQRRLLIAGHTAIVALIAIAVYLQVFGGDESPGPEIRIPANGGGVAGADDEQRKGPGGGAADANGGAGRDDAIGAAGGGAIAGITDQSGPPYGSGPWDGGVDPPDAQYSSSAALIARSLGLGEPPAAAP